MPFPRPQLRPPRLQPHAARHQAFTLTEILVVLGIILLLLSITFPVFKGIQERGNQTTCASNMQQIYLAVRLYKDDEREYPMSLAVLLPDTDFLQKTGPVSPTPVPPETGQANTDGTGYFRKGREILICPDDDTQTLETSNDSGAKTRSSYGDVTNNPLAKAAYETASAYARTDLTNDANTIDWGRTSWNYWGYDHLGIAFRSYDEVGNFVKDNLANAPSWVRSKDKKRPVVYDTSTPPNPTPIPIPPKAAEIDTASSGALYFNPRGYTDPDGGTNFSEDPRQANPLLYSLSNPFAPESTIITHCVFHRLSTAKNLIGPNPKPMYDVPADGQNARDVILRLDGSAKSYDVSTWNQPANAPKWIVQNF